MTGIAKMMMLRGGSESRGENESRGAENRRKTVIIHENDPRMAYGEMDYDMRGQTGYRSEQMENRGEQMYGRAGMNYDRSEMNYGIENRRYKNGRFAPKNENGGGSELRLIGFDRGQDVYPEDGRIEFGGDRKRMSYEPLRMHEMEYRTSPKTSGFASGSESRFTPEIASEWVRSMKRADGGRGEKWTIEEVRGLMRQHGIEKDPFKVWVAMNALYSDLCKVNEKYGIASKDYYLEAACVFWLDDKDAVADKLGAYYEYIVKK